jgi:hypothetical protein
VTSPSDSGAVVLAAAPSMTEWDNAYRAKLQAAGETWSARSGSVVWLVFGLVALVFTLLGAWRFGVDVWTVVSIPACAWLVGWHGLVVTGLSWKVTRSRRARACPPGMLAMSQVTVSDEGLVDVTGATELHRRWSAFPAHVVFSDGVLLMTAVRGNMDASLLLRRSASSVEEWQRALAMVRQQVPAHPGQSRVAHPREPALR